MWTAIPARVKECIAEMRSRWIHPHFAAYLCLKRTAFRDGSENGMHPDFQEFFDTYLRVTGAPTEKPYLRLFLDHMPSESNKWLNPNLGRGGEKLVTLLTVVMS